MHQKQPPAKIAVFILASGALEPVSAAWAAKANRAMAAIALILDIRAAPSLLAVTIGIGAHRENELSHRREIN